MKAEDAGMPPQHLAERWHAVWLGDDVVAKLSQNNVRLAHQVGDESGDVHGFCHLVSGTAHCQLFPWHRDAVTADCALGGCLPPLPTGLSDQTGLGGGQLRVNFPSWGEGLQWTRVTEDRETSRRVSRSTREMAQFAHSAARRIICSLACPRAQTSALGSAHVGRGNRLLVYCHRRGSATTSRAARARCGPGPCSRERPSHSAPCPGPV